MEKKYRKEEETNLKNQMLRNSTNSAIRLKCKWCAFTVDSIICREADESQRE
tara:strand:+ start:568 stop:723 length:156 start_codon:yes stop_codon:yes gene_type:complete